MHTPPGQLFLECSEGYEDDVADGVDLAFGSRLARAEAGFVMPPAYSQKALAVVPEVSFLDDVERVLAEGGSGIDADGGQP